MKDRIIKIMQDEGMNKSEFAEKIGVAVSLLSHIFGGRNNPSLDVVMRINKAFPDVNLQWLLYGEGEMRLSKGHEIPVNPTGGQMSLDFSNLKAPEPPILPPKEIVKEEVKYIEKPCPKITEIRIFFDNGTYEVFKPDK